MTPDRCSKHDETMSRIFDDTRKIEKKLESIDSKMDGIIDFKNMIHKVVFGNGEPGLKGNVETLKSNVTRLWVITLAVLGAIVTVCVAIIFKGGL